MNTAVEWLEDAINEVLSHLPLEREEIKMLIEKAKEMEKQQIIDAADWNVTEWQLHNGEQYYNESFNKK
jgi:hypothetical protein